MESPDPLDPEPLEPDPLLPEPLVPEPLVPEPLVPDPPGVEPDPDVGEVTTVADPPSSEPEPEPDPLRPLTPSEPPTLATPSDVPLPLLVPERSPECSTTVLGESSLPDSLVPEPDCWRSPLPE